MHVSELSRKFQQFVGKTLHLKNHNLIDDQTNHAAIGHNKPSQEIDETCPHTRRVLKQMSELAHKFNAEVIINGAKATTNAICQVHVNVGSDALLLSKSSITAIEARIYAP